MRAYGNLRHGGRVNTRSTQRPGLVQLRPQDAADVPAFEVERHLFPAPRITFLSHWLANPALAVRGPNGLRGYGAIRKCHEGFKIGPLFAEDRDMAADILNGLLAEAGDGPVFLDTPATNPEAVSLARSLGLVPMFETARMYRGPSPALNLASVFGITSFELG